LGYNSENGGGSIDSQNNNTPGTGTLLEQVKKQKGQIEKDVFNLRNRVRLLELEHKRAIKKISEAS
jgi:hypothetical protein